MYTLIVGLLAAIVFGASAGSATAATGASVTNGATLATASGRVTMNAGGINENCTVRLGMTLNSSIAKRAGTTIGTVQSTASGGSSITNCDLSTEGTVLHGIVVRYTSFAGTLPNITRINASAPLAGFLLQLPIFGSCLYQGTVNAVFNRNVTTLEITSVAISGTGLTGSPSGCPTPASLGGTLTVASPLPRINLI
jgi:hypothetical protein